MIQAEVYYGYYLGDAQVWDTTIVEIPDCPEIMIKENALTEFENHILEWTIDLAFYGLFHWEYMEDENADT